MKESLDKFGEIFIEEIRDRSIRIFDKRIRGEMNSDSSQKLAAKIRNLSDEAKNVIDEIVPDIVDLCLFNTLFLFEEYASDDIKLMVGQDDLNKISDGLAGELYTSDGWIEKYSKERYNKE